MREGKLITMYEVRAKIAAELEQQRAQEENKAFGFGKVESAFSDKERPAERAKVVRGSGNSLETPFPALYFTLPATPSEPKICCKVLALENQCVLGMAKPAKKLRAKVTDV